MAYEPSEHHPAFEEYSETIYELAEDGVAVIQARIAERMEVSRPAVSEMIHKMESEGLVSIASGEISLTASGRAIAKTVVRRHRLAERFLTDVLNLSWAEAHHEAGKWEHIISPNVEQALVRVLKNPNTCPHGNPIPGSGYTPPPDAVRLVEIDPKQRFVVERIPEELEFAAGQLDFLETSGLMPGRVGKVVSSDEDGTTTVEMDEGTSEVSPFTAERILVSHG